LTNRGHLFNLPGVKTYPSIPRSTGQSFREFSALIFDKLDGSLARFEWSRRSGWVKAGTKTHLIDASDEVFGVIPSLFASSLAEPLERIARRERWEGLVVFAEFTGPGSFAGVHLASDPKTLTVFDLAPLRRGILPPAEFRRICEGVIPTPRYLGSVRWTRGFVERVRRGDISGITFEGVVGKGADAHGSIMAKAKTQAWLDKVAALYAPEAARRIIES